MKVDLKKLLIGRSFSIEVDFIDFLLTFVARDLKGNKAAKRLFKLEK